MHFEIPGRFTLASALLATFLGGFAAVSHADTIDEEQVSAHVQMTYNWQYHPAYGAAYTGPNSIIPTAEKMYTFTTTGFFGFRPWQGGELYLTPEISQGVPFSTNLVGLGGFTNGEITRAAGTNPTLYRQKLFLRETWNNGGESQRVEPGQNNQMAGWVDKNRVVLTVGNFSTLDVFDPNTYAKDPRTQFMNWGNWTYAAYDYAADARGFGWGAAVEWYRNDWVLRAGRMTGPALPNMLPVDQKIFNHFGDQIEIEHEHSLSGHPGKVRVLGWRDRAILASFSDALVWLRANPNPAGGPYTGPDALIAVRGSEKNKYGLGINVEQELSDNTGFFMRIMQTDGRTETYAFTEVDGSLSAGVIIKGNAWGRSEDGIGVSLMRNVLSKDRRQFLAAGGTSFFIGDGALNYRPEDIFEGFYSYGLYKGGWLTADYQRMQNPAFNADRGPINIYALRFHAEF
ncbi:MAG: carbohydrate porin [Proteobacteria bacterium]|nr:carbohydrate porin [Pseudomonadota bacterium]